MKKMEWTDDLVKDIVSSAKKNGRSLKAECADRKISYSRFSAAKVRMNRRNGKPMMKAGAKAKRKYTKRKNKTPDVVEFNLEPSKSTEKVVIIVANKENLSSTVEALWQ